jgi:hypothetical protein
MYISIRSNRRDALGFLGQAFGNPTVDLGKALWREAPAGVTVAIYYDDPEQKRRAVEWAERQRAIGSRGRTIAANELIFGKPIGDSRNLASQITQLGRVLKAAVEGVPKPRHITPLPNTGPSLIRTLALFTHGTTSWISIGGGITSKGVGGVINRIAPFITDDVKIILYGCSSARGSKERSNWVTTTMTAGGEDSLAAKIRDALVDAGKSRASVWGHTEVGHTTRNPSLRYFYAGNGKGAKGHSYVGESIFGTVEDIVALDEIEIAVRELGFSVDAALQPRFRTSARRELRRLRYFCYVGANIRYRTVGGRKIKENNLTFRGANLSEVAPMYPLDVADIVRQHWSSTCWLRDARQKVGKSLVKELKLKRVT